MSGEQLLGIAAIISAFAGPVSLYMIARLSSQVAKVQKNIATGNDLDAGPILDKLYSGLIEAKEPGNRTAGEDEHMQTMADNDARAKEGSL